MGSLAWNWKKTAVRSARQAVAISLPLVARKAPGILPSVSRRPHVDDRALARFVRAEVLDRSIRRPKRLRRRHVRDERRQPACRHLVRWSHHRQAVDERERRAFPLRTVRRERVPVEFAKQRRGDESPRRPLEECTSRVSHDPGMISAGRRDQLRPGAASPRASRSPARRFRPRARDSASHVRRPGRQARRAAPARSPALPACRCAPRAQDFAAKDSSPSGQSVRASPRERSRQRPARR